MRDEGLAKDINAVARLSGTFTLRSGQVATEYFDKYRFEADPAMLQRLARRMAPLVPPETEMLAGLELGGVPIATALSFVTGLPTAFVRKKAKNYGTCKAVEGGDVRGRRVTLIEDVITTGGAVVDAARMMRDEGADILAVVCAIWRGEGAPHIAQLPDVPVMCALTKADLDAWG